MKNLPVVSVALICLSGVHDGCADTEKEKAKHRVWKGSVELGITATTGNTKSKNINAKADVIREKNKWRHHIHLSALNASNQGATTAERYYAKGDSRYSITKHNYLFGLVTYENNRFSGFHYNVTDTLGYGRRLVNNDSVRLDLEIGAGSRELKIIGTGQTQVEAQLHLGAGFEWDISDDTQFTQELSSNIGKLRSVSRSVTSLQTQLVGSLATSVSYTFEYTSKVPQGVAQTFTQTSVNLVYNF